MKRTDKLKLQKPDRGDVYNSNTLTQNVTAMDRFMANYGGNTAPVTITNWCKVRSADWTLNSSFLRILGNGEAAIYLNVTAKKELTINSAGRIDGAITLVDVLPEYATAISQPLSSMATGMAYNAYIAPDNTRVVLRLGFGNYPDGKVKVGEEISIGGIYPLANVPRSIGLEQMAPKSFDSDVHLRNLIKIDNVASRLKMKDTYRSWALSNFREVFTPAAGITVTAFQYRELIQGDRDLYIQVTKTGGFPSNSSGSGNITNVPLGSFVSGFAPGYDVPMFTTSSFSVAKAHISGGNLGLASLAGNTSPSSVRVAGRWIK